jgi:23S rRNA (guanine745-N1)-methyltransferase
MSTSPQAGRDQHGRTDLTALVSMGPSARHITPQALAARISVLPSTFTVTVDLQISVFQPPGTSPGTG